MTNIVKAKVEMKAFAICLHCGSPSFTITQYHIDNSKPFGPWYCNTCRKAHMITPRSFDDIDIELVEDKSNIPAWMVTTVEGTNPPVFIILDRYIFKDKEDNEQESHNSWRYLIESHTCPSNYLENKIVVNGDSDPHGVLKLIGIVAKEHWSDDLDDDRRVTEIIQKAYVNHRKYLNPEINVPKMYHSEELKLMVHIPETTVDLYSEDKWPDGREILKGIIDSYEHEYPHLIKLEHIEVDGTVKGVLEFKIAQSLEEAAPKEILDELELIMIGSISDYVSNVVERVKPYLKITDPVTRLDLANLALQGYEEDRVSKGAMSFKDIFRKALNLI
jgi:hypothetical protein